LSEADQIADARRWLRYAEEDLTLAEDLVERWRSGPRHACWLAQQAAEKALKAVLVLVQTDFPKTHDLDMLRRLLPQDCSVRTEPADVADLTEWAVEARYPGDWPEATLSDARRAVGVAKQVLAMTRQDLAAHGLPMG